MRTVTFSDEATAKRINENFVCAWLNKNPQQKFKDGLYKGLSGNDLKRTQDGAGVTNITSIFATPDGIVLHAVAGFLGTHSFEKQMNFALEVRNAISERTGELKKDAARIFRVLHEMRGWRRLGKSGLLRLDEFPTDVFNSPKLWHD